MAHHTIIVSLLCVFLLGMACDATPIAFNGTVYADPNGDGTFLAYLPPPAISNHAATIEQLPDGSLLLAWFSGLEEEAAGCAIAFSRLSVGTSQWRTPVIVAQRPNYSNQNPLLFYDNSTGVTHLYFSQVDRCFALIRCHNVS